MKPDRWLLVVPLTCVVLQGANTVVSKVSASVISPEAISFYRWVVAIVLLAPVLGRGLWRERALVREHLGRIFVLSFLGMVAYQVLVYVAAKTSTATSMALIGALAPLLSIGWSVLLLRYRPGPVVLVGCVLSLAGVIELVQKGDPFSVLSHAPDPSDVYVLIGVLCYALYGVLIRKWQLPISSGPFFFSQVLCALVITSAGPVFGNMTPLDEHNVSIVLLAALIGSVAVPFLWMKSIQSVGPVATAVFFNLMPLVTAVLAVLLIGEKLELYHGIGAVLIIGGVLLAQVETLRTAKSS